MQQAKQNKGPLQSDESLVNQVISKYLGYWPLFLLAVICAVSVAYVYLRYTVPKYEATATLIIKDEKKGNDDSKMLEQLNMIGTKKIIENEIEVLQSRSLMDNVVKSLHLYAPIFTDGKIKAISAYVSSPLTIEAANPDGVKDVKKVYLNYNDKNNTVDLDGKLAGPINEWLNTPYGKLKFELNDKYVASNTGRAFYFSLIPVKDVTKQILTSLKVTAASKLASIIDLSYRDAVPQKAEDVLNELIVNYDNAAILEKNSLAKNTLSFVEDRLKIVAHDLDSIEKNVQRYKAGAGATDISTQGQLYLQNVSANDQKLGEVNMQLSVVGQVEKAVSNNNNGTSVMPSTLGISDPNLTQLMTDLNGAEMQYTKMSKTVAENNPMLLSVKEQINKLRPQILENVQSQRRNLEASKQSLSSTNGKYNSMLSSMPQKERQLVDMSRDQNIKNGIYSFLLQKREESELSYASTLSDSRVVNSAQAGKLPVSPNKMLIYLAALAGAIGLCVAFIGAREVFSRKVLYRHEVESLTTIPIIGEVAYNKSKQELVIEAGKRSFIAEEFRKIRVSLHFLGIDSSHKKVLVTSSIPGEGKSFIAANLAISNALTGKKVALVDIDLHNPGLGRIFEKEEDKGVSDYLIDQAKPEDIISKVPGYENLSFIAAGTLQDNPSELLVNGKIEKLIEYLTGIYDIVIMDTAPVVLVTDAYILSPKADATLYVVRHKYTPKMLIKRIDETTRINPLKNPAIIFNGVKTRGFFKNNYGYGYDYVYGAKQQKKSKKTKKVLAGNYN
ncbi:MAG: polysaccharide biosynthesis tyrosine autokinase [Ferruginibacter sp.]